MNTAVTTSTPFAAAYTTQGYAEKSLPSVGDRAREYIPKGKVCPKCTNAGYLMPRKLDRYDKFCPNCGSELDEEVKDLYITIDSEYIDDYNYTSESPIPQIIAPKIDYPNKRITKSTISLRQLVILLKEYEKEMVIDGL